MLPLSILLLLIGSSIVSINAVTLQSPKINAAANEQVDSPIDFEFSYDDSSSDDYEPLSASFESDTAKQQQVPIHLAKSSTKNQNTLVKDAGFDLESSPIVGGSSSNIENGASSSRIQGEKPQSKNQLLGDIHNTPKKDTSLIDLTSVVSGSRQEAGVPTIVAQDTFQGPKNDIMIGSDGSGASAKGKVSASPDLARSADPKPIRGLSLESSPIVGGSSSKIENGASSFKAQEKPRSKNDNHNTSTKDTSLIDVTPVVNGSRQEAGVPTFAAQDTFQEPKNDITISNGSGKSKVSASPDLARSADPKPIRGLSLGLSPIVGGSSSNIENGASSSRIQGEKPQSKNQLQDDNHSTPKKDTSLIDVTPVVNGSRQENPIFVVQDTFQEPKNAITIGSDTIGNDSAKSKVSTSSDLARSADLKPIQKSSLESLLKSNDKKTISSEPSLAATSQINLLKSAYVESIPSTKSSTSYAAPTVSPIARPSMPPHVIPYSPQTTSTTSQSYAPPSISTSYVSPTTTAPYAAPSTTAKTYAPSTTSKSSGDSIISYAPSATAVSYAPLVSKIHAHSHSDSYSTVAPYASTTPAPYVHPTPASIATVLKIKVDDEDHKPLFHMPLEDLIRKLGGSFVTKMINQFLGKFDHTSTTTRAPEPTSSPAATSAPIVVSHLVVPVGAAAHLGKRIVRRKGRKGQKHQKLSNNKNNMRGAAALSTSSMAQSHQGHQLNGMRPVIHIDPRHRRKHAVQRPQGTVKVITLTRSRRQLPEDNTQVQGVQAQENAEFGQPKMTNPEPKKQSQSDEIGVSQFGERSVACQQSLRKLKVSLNEWDDIMNRLGADSAGEYRPLGTDFINHSLMNNVLNDLRSSIALAQGAFIVGDIQELQRKVRSAGIEVFRLSLNRDMSRNMPGLREKALRSRMIYNEFRRYCRV